jgi:hypothetical protein
MWYIGDMNHVPPLSSMSTLMDLILDHQNALRRGVPCICSRTIAHPKESHTSFETITVRNAIVRHFPCSCFRGFLHGDHPISYPNGLDLLALASSTATTIGTNKEADASIQTSMPQTHLSNGTISVLFVVDPRHYLSIRKARNNSSWRRVDICRDELPLLNDLRTKTWHRTGTRNATISLLMDHQVRSGRLVSLQELMLRLDLAWPAACKVRV